MLISGGLSTSDIEKAFKELLAKPPEQNQAIILGVRNTEDQDYPFLLFFDSFERG